MFYWHFTLSLESVNKLQLSYQGIYPDLLHILDLTIFPDLYGSSFLVWTDNRQIFNGRSRDDRLQQIYARYMHWCVTNRFLVTFNCFFCSFPLMFIFPLLNVFYSSEQVTHVNLRYSKWKPCKINSILAQFNSTKDNSIPCHRPKETQWCFCTDDGFLLC